MIIAGRLRGFVPVAVQITALAAALAGVGVAGCSGGSGTAAHTLPPLTSTSTPGPAASSSPAASPTTSAPAVQAGPPPHTAFTRQGAEQFVRAYYLTASRALTTGKSSALVLYTRSGCECRRQVELIRNLAAKGQHFIGHGYRIGNVAVDRLVGNSTIVSVTFALRSMPLVDESGHQVDKLTDIRKQTDQLLLRHLDGRWYVERVFFGHPS